MANKSHKVKKFLKEYADIKEQCEDLARTIESIVQSTLQEKNVKYQSVTHRVKSVESLKGKLSSPGATKINKSVTEVHDLVGCRVIFYLKKDREEALKHLKTELNGCEKRKPPNPGGYESPHLIVELNSDRLNLGEYKRFKGANLKCEIQFTTVLDHAWSELSHDVIYKPEEAIRRSNAFQVVRNLFSKVKEYHLVEAQRIFEMIYDNLDVIKQIHTQPGNSTLPIVLTLIDISTTTGDVYTSLAILKNHMSQANINIPQNNKIAKTLKDVLNRTKVLNEGLAYRTFPVGREQVVALCLEILEQPQYFYLDEVFEILRGLSIDESSNVRQKALESISKMAKYRYSPKEHKLYYQVQFFLLKEIETWIDTWNERDLRVYLSSIVKIAKALLSPSFDAISSDGEFKAYWIYGALPASDAIKGIRSRTVKRLRNLYYISKTVPEKQLVLKALKVALVRPDIPNQGDTADIDAIILENVNSIISFYSSIVANAEFEIIQTIKEQLHSCSLWFKDGLEGIENLQSLIARKADYQIYEVLVGLDRNFSPELSIRDVERVRVQKIDEYIEQITDSNFPQWRNRVLAVIKNYERERNEEFRYLRTFLYKIGEQRHTIAKRLVTEFDFEFRHFLSTLILGLWRGGQIRWAMGLLKNWVEEGKHLSDSAFLFRYVQEADVKLLGAIYRKADDLKDTSALANIIASIITNSVLHQVGKSLLIDCVKKLTEFGNASWLNSQVFNAESPILKTLTEDDWRIVLENQLIAPNINYDLEIILARLAKKSPHLVIGFFRQRSNKSEKQGYSINYNTIPVAMQSHLQDAFKKNATFIICEILRWIEDDLNSPRKSFSAANLLKEIFPNFDPELERQLIEIVTSGEKDRIAVVFRVLNTYNGDVSLHNVCKEIIKAYPGNQKYEQALFKILADTSSMGASPPFERVFLEYYQSDKKRIQKWKLDKHPAIQNFVAIYEKRLDEQIARLQDYLKNNQPPEENDPPIT